jgi:hypothetical protein
MVVCPNGCITGVPEDYCSGDPCGNVECNTPEEPQECYFANGVCSGGICNYDFVNGAGCDDLDACTQYDSCINGSCLGTPIYCDEPPEDTCFGANVLRKYSILGSCVEGECEYQHQDFTCAIACQNAECLQATEEICNGFDDDLDGKTDECETPPADDCLEGSARHYDDEGSCDDECYYSYTIEECTDGCQNGICQGGGNEICNGIDDNGDGQIDEGVLIEKANIDLGDQIGAPVKFGGDGPFAVVYPKDTCGDWCFQLEAAFVSSSFQKMENTVSGFPTGDFNELSELAWVGNYFAVSYYNYGAGYHLVEFGDDITPQAVTYGETEIGQAPGLVNHNEFWQAAPYDHLYRVTCCASMLVEDPPVDQNYSVFASRLVSSSSGVAHAYRTYGGSMECPLHLALDYFGGHTIQPSQLDTATGHSKCLPPEISMPGNGHFAVLWVHEGSQDELYLGHYYDSAGIWSGIGPVSLHQASSIDFISMAYNQTSDELGVIWQEGSSGSTSCYFGRITVQDELYDIQRVGSRCGGNILTYGSDYLVPVQETGSSLNFQTNIKRYGCQSPD